MHEFIESFADYVTLVYHEARNVRHLPKDKVDRQPYRRIIDHLPRDRWDAWRKLQPLRVAAKKERSAHEAGKIFRDKFGVGLEDLVVLFKNPNWRHAKLYGGNRWAEITRSVVEFKGTIEAEDSDRASQFQEHIRGMAHNTPGGTVGGKIRELDAWLESN